LFTEKLFQIKYKDATPIAAERIICAGKLPKVINVNISEEK
jgi:hypothetical protein